MYFRRYTGQKRLLEHLWDTVCKQLIVLGVNVMVCTPGVGGGGEGEASEVMCGFATSEEFLIDT